MKVVEWEEKLGRAKAVSAMPVGISASSLEGLADEDLLSFSSHQTGRSKEFRVILVPPRLRTRRVVRGIVRVNHMYVELRNIMT